MKKYNKEDSAFGKESELANLKILRRYFKCDDLKLTSEFCLFDYVSSKYNIEIKRRTCSYYSFFTTYIESNKLVERDNKETIFVFDFEDGLYYINYSQNKEFIDSIKPTKITIKKKTSNHNEERTVIEIPINNLHKIIYCML